MTILVIDIGSSSVRAMLFNEQVIPIPDSSVSYPHQFTIDTDGTSTADAETLRRLTERCIDHILQYPLATNIAIVGMATFVGNMLGVDPQGNPLTPIYTYADTRSAEDVALLHSQIDAYSTHQRTGCRLHAAYQPARLHWLRRTQPELFSRVAQWVDFGTYLYRCWFGDAACSYSIAAWTGMLDRQNLTWDSQWLRILEMEPEQLPPLADYNAIRQGLQPAYASRWKALQDVPFCLGVGDGAAANIGQGATTPEQMALTIGTTAALRIVSSEALPPVPAGLWGYRVDAKRHLIGGATSEGGSIFQWATDVLALPADSIEASLLKRKPDEHGLTFLPLLAGERAPGWQPNATGTISGLRLSTTPLDILQAALEGVALRLSLISDQLADEGVEVWAGGKAITASMAWAQIIANALNRRLHIIQESETTARGTALLALQALGADQTIDLQPTITNIVTPQPEAVAILRAARQRQLDLYHKLYPPEAH